MSDLDLSLEKLTRPATDCIRAVATAMLAQGSPRAEAVVVKLLAHASALAKEGPSKNTAIFAVFCVVDQFLNPKQERWSPLVRSKAAAEAAAPLRAVASALVALLPGLVVRMHGVVEGTFLGKITQLSNNWYVPPASSTRVLSEAEGVLDGVLRGDGLKRSLQSAVQGELVAPAGTPAAGADSAQKAKTAPPAPDDVLEVEESANRLRVVHMAEALLREGGPFGTLPVHRQAAHQQHLYNLMESATAQYRSAPCDANSRPVFDAIEAECAAIRREIRVYSAQEAATAQKRPREDDGGGAKDDSRAVVYGVTPVGIESDTGRFVPVTLRFPGAALPAAGICCPSGTIGIEQAMDEHSARCTDESASLARRHGFFHSAEMRRVPSFTVPGAFESRRPSPFSTNGLLVHAGSDAAPIMFASLRAQNNALLQAGSTGGRGIHRTWSLLPAEWGDTREFAALPVLHLASKS